MVDPSVLAYPRWRRRSASWTVKWAVAGMAVIAALAGLDQFGGQAPTPLLRASFVGPSTPEVQLQPMVAAPPTPRSGPIDVPADPYATEDVVEIGTIQIPKLGVQQRLMDGVTLRNIDLGPSHWPGTAMPGQPGNAVVAGHRVTHSRPFRNIDQLVSGDQIVLTTEDRRSTYQVVSSFVVTPDRTDIANQTAVPTLTLFACHPPGSARQRFVVQAALVTAEAV